MKSLIIAIDIGWYNSNTAICVSTLTPPFEIIDFGVIIKKDTCNSINGFIKEMCRKYVVLLETLQENSIESIYIAFEETYLGSNVKVLKRLCLAQGSIIGCTETFLMGKEVKIKNISVSTHENLKTAYEGEKVRQLERDERKSFIMKFIQKKFNISCEEQDNYDSVLTCLTSFNKYN